MRLIIYVFLLVLVGACGKPEKVSVVVTSSWTAAFVEAAGISDRVMLAPAEMQHPSEYELDINDIERLRQANLIVCGGYEIMMDRIRNGLKIDPDRILEIKTDYNLDHIRSSVMKIASRMGTEEIAIKNMAEIEEVFKLSREKIHHAGIDQQPVLVQFFIQAFARELGLNVTAVFGPKPLEVFDIHDLLNKEFKLILDNAHNPISGPLIESKKGVSVAFLINFPGTDGTRSLADVIRYNVERILEASGEL